MMICENSKISYLPTLIVKHNIHAMRSLGAHFKSLTIQLMLVTVHSITIDMHIECHQPLPKTSHCIMFAVILYRVINDMCTALFFSIAKHLSGCDNRIICWPTG